MFLRSVAVLRNKLAERIPEIIRNPRRIREFRFQICFGDLGDDFRFRCNGMANKLLSSRFPPSLQYSWSVTCFVKKKKSFHRNKIKNNIFFFFFDDLKSSNDP